MSSAPSAANSAPNSSLDIFHISPLIRITLVSLYGALTLPLPFLAAATQAPVPPWLLTLGIALGAVALHGALSQQVILDQEGIEVTYPQWMRWLLRTQWRLSWNQIQALKPRTTGQGGLVYYFVGSDQQAYLLPMRVAGFARLVGIVQSRTGIDTQDVRPLAQPWMYGILLLFTLFLLLIDGWTIWTAVQLG
ncbi:hypothetical protein [Pseudanabaena sp. FACHB-2040]|uniref:hypothetical protein n=1 Tax=Pseudanabaena sp. FACHB-2040 TaxID=2692859 RepID=UPI0016873EDB|nr:hypothetical protein [Pseudanabaena sp. FACHB-2040]MBD2257425.1 hypothetical protein [Pseudanabaena sp. FACHB-2040]